MRKSSILRLCLCLAVALFELPLMAQGVVVYKKDGTHVKFAYEEIDSIVTYNVDMDLDENEPVMPPAEAKQAIELNVDCLEKTNTNRGPIGAVNTWQGEKLNTYMFYRGTMNLALNPDDYDKPYFENTVITAPLGNSGIATYEGGLKYYDNDGTYDFFAYYADDAVSSVPVLNNTGDAYEVPITIDGTQDLMVAKAEMSNAGKEQYLVANDNLDRIYSAYSASCGVHPRFTFEHLLSRFVFHAEAAEEDSAGPNGIRITGIKIKAPTKGQMTVAALDEDDLGVVFDMNEDDFKTLELTDRGTRMNAKELVFGEKVALGESLLLPAGVSEYIANIYYEQLKGDKTIKDVYVAPIVLSGSRSFEAGMQYMVNIIIYNFSQMVLSTSLQAWEESGDVEVDGE